MWLLYNIGMELGFHGYGSGFMREKQPLLLLASFMDKLSTVLLICLTLCNCGQNLNSVPGRQWMTDLWAVSPSVETRSGKSDGERRGTLVEISQPAVCRHTWLYYFYLPAYCVPGSGSLCWMHTFYIGFVICVLQGRKPRYRDGRCQTGRFKLSLTWSHYLWHHAIFFRQLSDCSLKSHSSKICVWLVTKCQTKFK